MWLYVFGSMSRCLRHPYLAIATVHLLHVADSMFIKEACCYVIYLGVRHCGQTSNFCLRGQALQLRHYPTSVIVLLNATDELCLIVPVPRNVIGMPFLQLSQSQFLGEICTER